MKTTLTIEESARLIELGVDAKLASGESLVGGALFTLSDLLSILPKEIKTDDSASMNLVFYWNRVNKKWGAYYDNDPEIKLAPELIDALNNLLIWTIEQGYLKTEKI